ncbi:MAG: recombinase family protein [Brevundimonas sp.]|uniref:DNA invertase Pin-like site-specific DNA recombinase n=1 Tax=Brevundimonas vesicularis TaxID=41276 RepID=A0A7W9L789_BREVE|nr:recombinase family protein [Brevundimonas vesicularis]MBB5773189.1 DNA invertase Pin-like site-specific DNA recombinase [Brevundimonas vesicularis]
MLIGYSRCSARGQNHESQIDALERAGCERIFIETASGTRSDRPQLTELLDFARPGDTVVVLRLDRLARDVRQILDLVDQFTRRDIGLKSLSEAIDSTTPSGRLAVHTLAALGQYEVEQKRLACEAGRRAAIARGRMGGRPKAMDETKLKIAKALMADDQLSMSEIARQVGVAPSTLYRTLPGGRGMLLESSQV